MCVCVLCVGVLACEGTPPQIHPSPSLSPMLSGLLGILLPLLRFQALCCHTLLLWNSEHLNPVPPTCSSGSYSTEPSSQGRTNSLNRAAYGNSVNTNDNHDMENSGSGYLLLFISPRWNFSGDPKFKKNHWCSWWASSLWPAWAWSWPHLALACELSSFWDFIEVSFVTCSAHQQSQKVGRQVWFSHFSDEEPKLGKAACVPVSYPAGRGQKARSKT